MAIDLGIEPKELTRARSFTMRPSTLAMIEEYADLKGTNSSRVVETLVRHFIPRIIAEEKKGSTK